GYTPLMVATIKGYTEIVKVLLEAGADINIKKFGRKAFDMARDNKKSDIETLLLQEMKRRIEKGKVKLVLDNMRRSLSRQ
ncbi:MAG: ankyrin repeat domain-containing protein, partial [Alphaproteobacteria bacterium]|nr:ankyrin repeat domain-containing protein [Alphaproteobacteria bacterium]